MCVSPFFVSCVSFLFHLKTFINCLSPPRPFLPFSFSLQQSYACSFLSSSISVLLHSFSCFSLSYLSISYLFLPLSLCLCFPFVFVQVHCLSYVLCDRSISLLDSCPPRLFSFLCICCCFHFTCYFFLPVFIPLFLSVYFVFLISPTFIPFVLFLFSSHFLLRQLFFFPYFLTLLFLLGFQYRILFLFLFFVFFFYFALLRQFLSISPFPSFSN